jgi:endoglycosylceramidase
MKLRGYTALSSLAWTTASAFHTSSSDTFIYDEHERVSFFHGTNFVQKGYPWYPEALLDSDHIQEMKSWGFNTLRLGVMWSGVEPELGVFNETYIQIIDGILDDLEANGIHALIDVHQGGSLQG